MLYVQVHLTLPAWVHDEIDSAARYDSDEARVGLAIHLSRRNVELDTGGPFGAAVFDGDGRLIAAGVNRVVQHNCSVAHAEMMAFMTAQARTQRFRLNEDGRRYVLALGPQNTAEYRPVELGPMIDGLRVVSAGLESGEKIIITKASAAARARAGPRPSAPGSPIARAPRRSGNVSIAPVQDMRPADIEANAARFVTSGG